MPIRKCATCGKKEMLRKEMLKRAPASENCTRCQQNISNKKRREKEKELKIIALSIKPNTK